MYGLFKSNDERNYCDSDSVWKDKQRVKLKYTWKDCLYVGRWFVRGLMTFVQAHVGTLVYAVITQACQKEIFARRSCTCAEFSIIRFLSKMRHLIFESMMGRRIKHYDRLYKVLVIKKYSKTFQFFNRDFQ